MYLPTSLSQKRKRRKRIIQIDCKKFEHVGINGYEKEKKQEQTGRKCVEKGNCLA